MDLKNFDKHIKSTLENIEAPFDSASWQALENRMNNAFAEETPSPVEPVDLMVKRSLERMEVPYQSADWSLLNNRLNQNILVRKIRLSKVAEAAIFLLLLANIEGFLGGFREVLKPAVPQPPKSSVPMADNHRSKGGKHQKSASSNANDDRGIAALADKVVALLAAPIESIMVGSINPAADPMATAIPVLTANGSVLDASNFYSRSGIVPFHTIAPLPQAKTQNFAWKNFFEPIPGVIIPSPGKSNGLFASSFASFDKNSIHAADYTSKENGFGGGIAVAYRKGKWGIESGLAYSHKSFTPKKDIDIYAGNPIDGFLGAYVKDVQADVFSVPVKATRRFARVGRTMAHAVAGVTVHVATEKRFAFKSIYYPPPSQQTPDPTQGPDPNQNPIPGKNNNGFLEGGSFNTNVYATADLGLRLEQPIGKRYIAFVEPTYRQSLSKGFGPKRERINTFSFQAGVMASL